MSLKQDAFAVLLPAIDTLTLAQPLRSYFQEGGITLLLGESRDEYVAREMAPARKSAETAAQFRTLFQEVQELAGTAIIAIDQEPAGICRLHDLVPALPDLAALHALSSEAIEAAAQLMAIAARDIGIRMVLAPVVDVVSGKNSWLTNRTLGQDPAEVARISAAFIRGVEAAGLIAVPKHFPGHHDIDADPALEIATVSGDMAALRPGFTPIEAAIAAKARGFMAGPALVPAVDADLPSSLSPKTISLLKDIGFSGLVVSDDLDAIGLLRGQRSVAEAAVAALLAGCDLLLLSAANDLEALRQHILQAVESGHLPAQRLQEAAARVRALA